jgi:hypothetical protein
MIKTRMKRWTEHIARMGQKYIHFFLSVQEGKMDQLGDIDVDGMMLLR